MLDLESTLTLDEITERNVRKELKLRDETRIENLQKRCTRCKFSAANRALELLFSPTLERIPKAASVIDMSCGNGTFTKLLRSMNKELIIDSVGVILHNKVDKSTFRWVHEAYNMRVWFSSWYAGFYPAVTPEARWVHSNWYSVILGGTMLLYLTEPKAYIKEWHRILVNNGTLCLIAGSSHGYSESKEEILKMCEGRFLLTESLSYNIECGKRNEILILRKETH